ncbi:hypothetical protein [Rubellimicrobium aerolatum]|uniref:Uncharacterized protein n=1 Tax=Rubellimicrobium aerolatum TaxID=490979 RepID=A0ABW0S9T0_9RHOB|nr:hypothetical protein [Rubellimicrobium aerolatum]MBP1805035.1 hypothetical protein [Rubellimicrobium aerolatum]
MSARTAVLVLGTGWDTGRALTDLLDGGRDRTAAEAFPAAGPRMRQVAALTDRVLAASGRSWHDWRPGPVPGPDSAEGRGLRESAALIVRGMDGAGPLVLGDPLLGRVLPVWRDALDGGHRPVAVLTLAEPMAFARALRAAEGLPLAHGALLWMRLALDAERLGRGLPRVVLRPGAPWDALERLGLDLPPGGGPATETPPPPGREEVAEAGVPALGEAWRCFAILDRWASEGERPEDRATLDGMGAALDAAAWAYVDPPDDRRLAAGLARAEASARALGEDRDRQAWELGVLARLLSEAESRLDRQRGEVRAARSALAASERRYAAIVGSTSWRITAPLRRVAAKLGQGRGS